MSFVNVLSNVVFGRSNFCCLCFKDIGENPVYNDDVVFLESEEGETMYQILETIFRGEILHTISTFGIFCDECRVSTVNSYKFMKSCKENSDKLCSAIDSIKDAIHHTSPDLDCYKSLLISLNLNDFATMQVYDDNSEVDMKPKDAKIENLYDIPSIPTSDIVNSYNPLEYRCKVCLKKFLEPEILRNHYFKTHHPKREKCSKCPNKFISRKLLEIHDKKDHNAGECSVCGKSFTSKYVLRKHEMNHFTVVVCPDCGRKYHSEEAFKKHITDKICGQKMKKTSVQGIYQCDFCKKRYCHKPYLAKHIKYEHENAVGFRCKFCNKQFYTKSRLETHVVKHTREKNFVCAICQGRFVTKASLVYHTRLHTGEKPYQCEYCDMAFLSSSRRLDHARRHHLEPSLECDICHVKFKATGSLLKHRKRHLNPNSRLSNSRVYSKDIITEV